MSGGGEHHTMPLAHCTHPCANGVECSNKGRHDYEGRKVCKRHLEFLKAREECAICLTAMNGEAEGDVRMRLACGHYFHKRCLSGMVKAECPLCRRAIEPRLCLDIFDNTCIEAVMGEVFTQPLHVQDTIVETFDMINGIQGVGGEDFTHGINYLVQIYRNMMNIPGIREDNTVMQLVNVFLDGARYRHQNGTLVGFVAGVAGSPVPEWA